MAVVNTPEYDHLGKIAVLYEGQDNSEACQQLAKRLAIPLYDSLQLQNNQQQGLFLSWRKGKLSLIDQGSLKKGGLNVDFDVRSEEQRSWPAPKKGPLAQAIGRKTQTVLDATCGWGQDSFLIFRMGYQLTCMERSRVMAELLQDGLQRLAQQPWMRQLAIAPPLLLCGNAISVLPTLQTQPDCIYMDPMFPPKRKKSALSKKSMTILRDLLGNDTDREQLFASAIKTAGKRVIVKSPDYAEPLAAKPDASFQGKLVRYDVFLT